MSGSRVKASQLKCSHYRTAVHMIIHYLHALLDAFGNSTHVGGLVQSFHDLRHARNLANWGRGRGVRRGRIQRQKKEPSRQDMLQSCAHSYASTHTHTDAHRETQIGTHLLLKILNFVWIWEERANELVKLCIAAKRSL